MIFGVFSPDAHIPVVGYSDFTHNHVLVNTTKKISFVYISKIYIFIKCMSTFENI